MQYPLTHTRRHTFSLQPEYSSSEFTQTFLLTILVVCTPCPCSILEIVWQQYQEQYYHGAHNKAHMFRKLENDFENDQTFFISSTTYRGHFKLYMVIVGLTLYIMIPLSHLLLKSFKGQQAFWFDPTFSHFCHTIVTM